MKIVAEGAFGAFSALSPSKGRPNWAGGHIKAGGHREAGGQKGKKFATQIFFIIKLIEISYEISNENSR